MIIKPKLRSNFSIFWLNLKAAFTKLEHIRIHEFPCFLYIGQVSNAFQQKQNFGSSFECFVTKVEIRSSFECFSQKQNFIYQMFATSFLAFVQWLITT